MALESRKLFDRVLMFRENGPRNCRDCDVGSFESYHGLDIALATTQMESEHFPLKSYGDPIHLSENLQSIFLHIQYPLVTLQSALKSCRTLSHYTTNQIPESSMNT